MPTYRYLCPKCNTIELHRSIYDVPLVRCPFCSSGVIQVLTPPNIAAAATPNKSGSVNLINQTEARWDKDMPAYKRLRADGIQPSRIDGAAQIESQAETRFEVESGSLHPGGAKQIESEIAKGA